MYTYDLFVTCGPDFEPLLADELSEFGISKLRQGYCGVYVDQASIREIYLINYCSRIGGRVLVLLQVFECRNQRDLYQGVRDIEWLAFIRPKNTFAIDANVTHRELRNSLFAAQVMKDAICDQIRDKTGDRPSIDTKDPDIQLNLFIHGNKAVVSFDTSGQPLHRRGYRIESVEAPIQESLAAAFLRLGGYTGEQILLDPCCGSGTFLIEAALIASKTAPGFLRKEWGFQRFPHFSQADWLKVKAEVDLQRVSLQTQKIFGIEINKNNVRVAKINLKAAGFSQQIEVMQGDFREIEPSILPNFVITNPPHGQRLNSIDQLIPLYRGLGDFFKRKAAKPSKGFIFTGSFELSKEVGLKASKRHVFKTSGIESRFLEYDVY